MTPFKRMQSLVLALLNRIYNFNRYSPFEITHRRRWYQQITQTNAKNASASRKKPMTYTKPKKIRGLFLSFQVEFHTELDIDRIRSLVMTWGWCDWTEFLNSSKNWPWFSVTVSFEWHKTIRFYYWTIAAVCILYT